MAMPFREWRICNSGTLADYESYLQDLAEATGEPATPDSHRRIRIRWSETRWYETVITRRDLAEAITAKGPEDDGHKLPADLSGLTGSPFGHGDLNRLLCDLEPDSLTGVDGIEVSYVREHIRQPADPAETGVRGDYAPSAGEPGPEYRVIYQFGDTEVTGIRAHATREEAEAEGRAADDPGLDGWHVEPPACASCGTGKGPDRQARWEAGVAREKLEAWEACERCGAPLCDSCALAGASHDCQDTGQEVPS